MSGLFGAVGAKKKLGPTGMPNEVVGTGLDGVMPSHTGPAAPSPGARGLKGGERGSQTAVTLSKDVYLIEARTTQEANMHPERRSSSL